MTLALKSRLALAAVIPLLLLAACNSDDGDDGTMTAEAVETARAIPVEVTTVAADSFEEVIQMTGTIEAPDDATLSAESSGTLRSLAPLGAVVRAGQVVAQIDPTLARAGVGQAEAAVESARAQLALAEDQFRRQEPLYRDSIISALEFEAVRAQRAGARAQVAQAEASLAQAREQLARTRVVAPFTGAVEAHLVERGSQVNPGMPVIRLVSTRSVRVRAGVPERYSGDVGVGTTVIVQPQAYDLPPRRAEIVFAGQSIDPQNRTFPIEVALDNPDGRLRPQMVVRLEVSRRTLTDVIAVPMSAVIRDEDGTHVFVITHETNPRARRLPVVVGPSGGGRIVIREGIEIGDRVIIQGQTTVADGDRVRVTTESAGGALTTHTSR